MPSCPPEMIHELSHRRFPRGYISNYFHPPYRLNGPDPGKFGRLAAQMGAKLPQFPF